KGIGMPATRLPPGWRLHRLILPGRNGALGIAGPDGTGRRQLGTLQTQLGQLLRRWLFIVILRTGALGKTEQECAGKKMYFGIAISCFHLCDPTATTKGLCDCCIFCWIE